MSVRLKVLVACEYSGTVRDAFATLGHDAWSCDLLPSEKPGQHIQGDISLALAWRWDLIIAHPPCDHLCVSGARWFAEKRLDGRQESGVDFFMQFADHDCPCVAIENPIGIMSRLWRKPDQILQPWQFGHGEVKATCLWLKGLSVLRATNIVSGREARVHRMPPGPNRWKERSRTFQGVADAMALQWTPHGGGA